TLTVVGLADTIDADRDGESVPFEEFAVARLNERAVRRDREARTNRAARSHLERELGAFAKERATNERLAPEKSEVDALHCPNVTKQQLQRTERGISLH